MVKKPRIMLATSTCDGVSLPCAACRRRRRFILPTSRSKRTAQRIELLPELLHLCLQQVPNRKYPQKSACPINHREMPEVVTDHCCECIASARLWRDCLHGRGHEFVDANSAGSSPLRASFLRTSRSVKIPTTLFPCTTATAPTWRATITWTASATVESGRTTAGSSHRSAECS